MLQEALFVFHEVEETIRCEFMMKWVTATILSDIDRLGARGHVLLSKSETASQ
jgi:hypothetical protein